VRPSIGRSTFDFRDAGVHVAQVRHAVQLARLLDTHFYPHVRNQPKKTLFLFLITLGQIKKRGKFEPWRFESGDSSLKRWGHLPGG
jgi:hypothetical protein